MDTSVVVVGAGPAGLMLAGELRLAGADVVLVDRLDGLTGESRGMGFTARTMEMFRQRGLLHHFGDVITPIAGHFGSLPLDFTPENGAHAGVSGIPQRFTEQVLHDWVTSLGVTVAYGRELTALTDDGDAVEAEITGPHGTERVRAAYLVGCDGGRSTVRRLGGFGFPGHDATVELLLADISGPAVAPRFTGERSTAGIVLAAPLGPDVTRIVIRLHGTRPRQRTGPVEFAEVATAWEKLTGEDIGDATPHWVSSFTDAARLVDTYRRGRVLLAGDAAHIHLPAGGQGMNVSLQDSFNLGWKLGSVVTGRAPASLLDTYHEERHPVGRTLITNTLAQGTLFFGGSETQPLRDVVGRLIGFDEPNRFLIGQASGLDIRYDVGTGTHPALGLCVPALDVVTAQAPTSATPVHELLGPARGVLLDLADDPGPRALAAPWDDRVDVVTGTLQNLPPAHPFAGTDAVLLRPDGHVVWTSPGTDDGLETALNRWFGTPHRRRG
ncbi:FAD-dependent monooxygenase [Streptomyces brasiliscabiei]|uniref:FAD-dependent monooxygenase n=1 Tax=Streptomyces brasiliscabiei TaxID=2736302 RepID=UPI001C0FA961|nr:FAD-dependent monooxygenase [Streptomyces brasiliscabiei]